MAATTRWRDTEMELFDVALASLIDEVTSEERISNITWDNWNLQKMFEENQHISLNGRE